MGEGLCAVADAMEERKVGVQITASSDDVDVTTPESEIVKAKLENHHIKQLANLLKPHTMSSVEALLKKHLKPDNFLNAETGKHQVTVMPLALHSGLWRWMPDFALKPVPKETGRVHVGLQVGPYVVDWTDSHLVSIRALSSCQPLVLVPVGPEEELVSGTADEAAAVLAKVAEVVVKWNLSKKFDAKKGSPGAFVEEL